MSRSGGDPTPHSTDSDIPSQPPSYNELEDNPQYTTASNDDSDNEDHHIRDHPLPSHGIEQFEIDDMFDDDDSNVRREGFLERASLMTKKFAYRLNFSIFHPVTKIVDPIYEAYSHFNQLYEQFILKLGNPLVVNRLFYVFFVVILIFFITKYDTTDGVNGASGGAFSSGRLYDIDKLGGSIKGFIDGKLMKENLEYLSSMPHITGTKGDLTLARYIEKYMANNGIKVIDFNELQSCTNYPVFNEKETYLKLSDDSFSAKLYEQHSRDMEYLAYSPNGLNTNEEIESSFVFANFGTAADLQKLKDNGIKLKDSIILIKYGGEDAIPEANKLQLAQQEGAKAIVFITPKFRVDDVDHDDIIQNNNVGLTRLSPGDILTPGWSADDGYVTRLPWFKSEITPKIPSIPISWKDGQALLSKLNNKGINFGENYSGDGNSDVKMKLKIKNEQRPIHQIWNVVGMIEGREQAEKGIIIGASRDSGCSGTLGTNTGSVILLELIKIFTSLQRQYKWSPSRSIYFVSFDATEYNFAGSTEWIENRKQSLKKEGYAYIDLSDVVSGDDLQIRSHPYLNQLIKDSLKKVTIENGKFKNMYELFKNSNNNKDFISNNLIESKNYLPFINLLNIPSLEIKFTGKKYPKNSCFDNFENFESSKIDPLMEKHAQTVELLSLIALNLAEAPIIPYNLQEFALRLLQMVQDLERFSSDISRNLPDKPRLNFGALRDAVESLQIPAGQFHDWCNGWRQSIHDSADIEPSFLAMNRWKWHDNLIRFNEGFILKDTTKSRPGFLNILFGVPFAAPEISNEQYEWNSFPTIRDSLTVNDFSRAQHEIDQISELILRSGQHILEQ